MTFLWLERLLSSVGIGGFYIHRKHVESDGYTTEIIEGPYKNPDKEYKLLFSGATAKYHLRSPKGVAPTEI
jgi:hypothetical protein